MSMTKEEIKELAWLDSHEHIRQTIIPKMSPEQASIFVNYFIPEKLLDFDNWTDEDIALYLTLSLRHTLPGNSA